MALLAEWNAGRYSARTPVPASRRAPRWPWSRCLAHADRLRPGRAAVEAIWITAQQHGMAVQPLAGVPVCPQPRRASGVVADVRPRPAPSAGQFRQLARTGPEESQVLVLRFCDAPRHRYAAVDAASTVRPLLR